MPDTIQARITVIEAKVERLEMDRARDHALGERNEDKIYARFDEIDRRLRHLEMRIAYAAGGIMLLQSVISIAIKLLWPAH